MNEKEPERYTAGEIIAGAEDGTFKDGDKFQMNNGYTDYHAILTDENGQFALTEIDLKFPVKTDNPARVWWKMRPGERHDAE